MYDLTIIFFTKKYMYMNISYWLSKFERFMKCYSEIFI